MQKDLQNAIELRESSQAAEALEHMLGILKFQPKDAFLLYQLAWTYDVLGLEREAIPYYEQALSLELAERYRAGAMLGLGSTYRTLGHYEKAKEILEDGLVKYPENKEFGVFLAMALYNLGEYEAAMRRLLHELGDTSSHSGIQEYSKAIHFYADRLNETW
ncbi:tetratricopeptide (TPR) repeat protein [Paenibacillus shirakamiensis]|uniref:Tetratricopeptide (TPR) repeat protein n=1 Tax=Paenibacillus shirakamiensis TaxID=1265935 RepID=A0ABS4JI86_9BACL|nr:tetratricopeptide repeat protein [Paenibacillus shirakamiensis]MBP2000681.1 tetratricopeptide (TPR) repeat protein [Paenibacillus shirakamiensis]